MEAIKCPNCGADLMADEKMYFCPYCGVGIPKVEKKAPINIRQTNKYNTTIQYTEPKTAVDKFLDHRKAMRIAKEETKISLAEERSRNRIAEAELRQRMKEAEAQEEIERRKRIEANEKRKKTEFRWKIIARVIVALLIPVCFLLFDPPLIALIASIFLLIVCAMIR